MLLDDHAFRMALKDTFISQRVITGILERLGQYAHV